jgi:hypothetical protein
MIAAMAIITIIIIIAIAAVAIISSFMIFGLWSPPLAAEVSALTRVVHVHVLISPAKPLVGTI